jgi:hypothetical protein
MKRTLFLALPSAGPAPLLIRFRSRGISVDTIDGQVYKQTHLVVSVVL